MLMMFAEDAYILVFRIIAQALDVAHAMLRYPLGIIPTLAYTTCTMYGQLLLPKLKGAHESFHIYHPYLDGMTRPLL